MEEQSAQQSHAAEEVPPSEPPQSTTEHQCSTVVDSAGSTGLPDTIPNQSNSPAASEDVQQVSPLEWRNRICEIQRTRVSPQVIDEMIAKANKQKKAQRSYKTAQVMERCHGMSARAQEVNLRKAYIASPQLAMTAPPPAERSFLGGIFGQRATSSSAAPPLPAAQRQEYLHKASKRSAETAEVLQQTLRTRRTADNEDVDDEEDASNFVMVTAELDRLEREIQEEEVEATPMALGVSADVPVPDSFAGLLESRATEPSDDAERTAKYAVFENFLATVVAIREQLLAFWDENRDQFEGPARVECDRAIKAIDSHEALSIAEDPRKWFVYFMMKQAHKNHQAITRTLASIRSRLELLATADTECPFCLDTVTAESGVTLGCCHRTCKPCWDQWRELKGSRAFCPLCRHQEFVNELFTYR